MEVRVKANMVGFIHGEMKRDTSPPFEIEDHQFSENWMEPTEQPKKRGRKPKDKGE